ncbi:XkdQ/YqbQ family protein [Anaerosporobacter sp.]
MKIVWIDSKSNQNIITDFVQDVTWSGSVNQATRQLSISVLYSPIDKNIKDLGIKMGDRLLFYDEGYLLIDAMVYRRGKQSEQGTITYDAYDELKRFVKSNCSYNFNNTTPEMIVKTLCNALKVKVGNIAETKVPIKKLLVESEGFYTVIMKAYTKAYKASGKKYMPIMIGKKLSIIEKGEMVDSFYLSDKVNITTSNYEESIENMINVVKIYDEKGKQVGVVKNDKNINMYGIFQDAYVKEEGVNATTAAKNMLIGVSKEASIEAIGNIKCISGYAVKIKYSLTGLTGKFWIDTDSHTWSNGVHTMSLNLAFKNIMDTQEE